MIFGVINIVQSWALHKRGPVYVAMFKPLQMIIAAVLGIMFLGDALHLGSYYMSIPSSPRLDRYIYRLHAQTLTLVGLVGVAAVEYYDQRTRVKPDPYLIWPVDPVVYPYFEPNVKFNAVRGIHGVKLIKIFDLAGDRTRKQGTAAWGVDLGYFGLAISAGGG